MANEYGELEQLVNDVTSLDTARMTLRWALERLNTIEKDKADLKKSLTLAEETAKKLQAKEASLQDAYSSRNKTLEEKEDFYTKLEATMSLLGEGKLDIQQLLKKEAKLDSLRKSLETEYEDKFTELDRNQRSIIERWNTRLLEVESQYAGRLAEAQKKYDSLRAELDAEHQVRLTELQASFRAKEKDQLSRIEFLESSVHESEAKVENRRRELETEYMQKRKEADGNYRKLRAMLEADMQEKLRAMDSDHSAQVSSLEASWQTERARLLEEQRVREEQFLAAQARIKDLENGMAVRQEEHHAELLKMISAKEAGFRAQLAELEKEKAAKEAHVRELTAALEKRAAGWEEEQGRIKADFEQRAARMEAALKDREAGLEKEFAAKKEEALKTSFAGKEELEKEFESRLADERRAMDAERSRMETERGRLGAALEAAAGKIKDMEGMLAGLREEHRVEMMSRIAETEAGFRSRLESFESEKRHYNETIDGMAEEMRRRETASVEMQKDFEAEFSSRAAVYEEKLAALTRKLEEASSAAARQVEAHRADLASYAAEAGASAQEQYDALRAEYEEKVLVLRKKLDEASAAAAKQGEAHRAELASYAAEAGASAQEHFDALRADYEERSRKAEEKAAAAVEVYRAEVQDGFASERNMWASEKERFENTLKDLSEKFHGAQVEIVGLNSALRKAAEESSAREAAITRDLLEAKAGFEKELPGRVREAVLSQTAALVEAMEVLKAEKSDLAEGILKKDKEISVLREESARTNAEVETRLLAEYSDAIEIKRSEMAKAYEAMRLSLEEDRKQSRAAMEREVALLTAHLKEENASMREALEKMTASSSSANAKAAELSEKLLAAEKAFHSDKLEMQKLYVKEIDETVVSAVDAAVEVAEQKLRQATEEAAALRKANTELNDSLQNFEKMAHDEKLAMQKEQMREMDVAIAEAVDVAVEEYAQRLKQLQDEVARLKKQGQEELQLAKEGAAAEKERLMEEMDRRDNYIERSELKIQELEYEMIKYRQSASAELMRSISEQDARFRSAAAEEKARSETRVKQLEDLVSTKEKLLAENDRFHKQKQLELDSMRADLNMRLSESNENLLAKENALNDLRLQLEKEYALKEAELGSMKSELARAIRDYKNRK